MLEKNKIFIALLHSAGCTHTQLTMLFWKEKRDGQEVYDGFLGKTPLENIDWIPKQKQLEITKNLKKIDVENLKKIIKEKQIDIVLEDEEKYPSRLRQLPKRPYILYVRGKLQEFPIQLGIVGSRKYSPYGKKVIEHLVKDFQNYPIGIISGGAYGIDGIAHQSALDNNLYTLAVFGCGIDIFYPTQNSKLFEDILKNDGALMSPFPIGSEPTRYTFPIRNTIVAGLSDGVIIAEAAPKSGTLITARLALEQNKDVFVVPWEIFKTNSLGSNNLIIKWEAKPILEASQILEEYGIKNTSGSTEDAKKTINFSNEDAKRIYEQVQLGNNTPDSISQNILIDHTTIITELTLLEIEWHLRLLSDGSYECT